MYSIISGLGQKIFDQAGVVGLLLFAAAVFQTVMLTRERLGRDRDRRETQSEALRRVEAQNAMALGLSELRGMIVMLANRIDR
jgi:hypothetical protein